MTMSRLESYGVAVRTGPRPRRLAHVHRNGEPRALCGVGPVVWIGDADNVDDACSWPICAKCCDIAGPDIVEDWNDAAS